MKVCVWAVIAVTLCASATAAQAPVKVTNPEWLRTPSHSQLETVFPSRAKSDGKASIRCEVTTLGVLHDCTVVDEAPAGVGFGRSVLALASQFIMKPAFIDGKAVEAQTVVTVEFKTDGYDTRALKLVREPLATVLPDAVWLATPTVSDILAELDKKSGAKSGDGSILIQCFLDRDSGKLSNCDAVYASPGMAVFTGVARSLTAKFRADPSALTRLGKVNRVNLAFSFPDMRAQAWTQRYLTDPHWIRTISPDPDKATFPAAAEKAGLKTGSAVVDCVLSATGALTQCQVVRESVPGVGFGPMAKEIAEVFVANPWSDGSPVEGAHVRMPIQMDYTPQAPAPTPATKP